MRILVVEDDASLAEAITDWLRLDGYAVDLVTRGDHADMALKTHKYDCILLDRGLPVLDGDQVLERLRTRKQKTPVIFITARDTLSDKVYGLDAGADDYLVKPFDLAEMSARIRVAIRRAGEQTQALLTFGPLTLNASSHAVCFNGHPVTLSIREFAVLQALMTRPGHILSRAQLEESLYGWGDEVESNAVEVYIHHLRRKLDNKLIRTIRNQGYRLEK